MAFELSPGLVSTPQGNIWGIWAKKHPRLVSSFVAFAAWATVNASKLENGFVNLTAPINSSVYGVAYNNNKQELKRAMDSCDKNLSICTPHVLAFRNMVRTMRQIYEPIAKAQAANAWVNTAIAYDDSEAGIFTLKSFTHRTMIQALNDGQAVCDEQAQLKEALLEMGGYPAAKVRLVAGAIAQNGHWGGMHALVEIQSGDQSWLLNNDQSVATWKKNEIPTPGQAASHITSNSYLESPDSSSNFTIWQDSTSKFRPVIVISGRGSTTYNHSPTFYTGHNTPHYDENLSYFDMEQVSHDYTYGAALAANMEDALSFHSRIRRGLFKNLPHYDRD